MCFATDKKEHTPEDLEAVKNLSSFRNLLAESLHAFEPEDTVKDTMVRFFKFSVYHFVLLTND